MVLSTTYDKYFGHNTYDKKIHTTKKGNKLS